MWINNNFDKYDELPFKESRFQYITRKYGNMYNLKCFDHSWRTDEYAPYKILYRILDNNIGKSFDLAFSYYCKKVDSQYQHLFLREFDKQRFQRYSNYILDENKIIRKQLKND